MSDKLLDLLTLYQNLFRQKTLKELSFTIAQQSVNVLPYENSVVFEVYSKSTINILAISDIVEIDKNAPYSLFIKSLAKELLKTKKETTSFIEADNTQSSFITANADQLSQSTQESWHDQKTKHFLFAPFTSVSDEIIGGAIFFNETEYNDNDCQRFSMIYQGYNHLWQSLYQAKRYSVLRYKRLIRNKKFLLSALVVLILVMFIPVRQSALGQAEIIAQDPNIIATPLDGVIDKVYVKPNQWVNKGERLFLLDQRDLLNAELAAKGAYETANAEYQKAVHSSFKDVKNRAEVEILKLRRNEREIEVNYTKEKLLRSDVTSPSVGIVIMNDPYEWEGKPVQTGEKVLEIASPQKVEIKVWLPVDDYLNFKAGDEVSLFLNNHPLKAIDATIKSVGIHAEIGPQNILAYPVIAEFDHKSSQHLNHLPRIGSQGTAKLYGSRVSLFFYLFRKPITAVRQYFGW
ncbi:efflux RND transporter periplasmic adaptor subunit [Fangia hongkongensis]|uniref:efflux RND transporter periplasmic adaptor subunit n=1 Tax=Fangia hongkongensis TaxID=270495 RepID=UPI00036B1527|nr:HlyD family efflux transporter periplasmic adaptor subunit [Fangia hongkongensis]MBK2124808.1 HlyD family efflux transporter periplasmic adaptor subunit [Fangia hongkongensis]